MNKPHVYIIILNYQQWEDTRDCIESVLLSGYTQYSIIVIDNNSPNRSMEQLIKWTGSEAMRHTIGQGDNKRKTGYGFFNREQFESVPDTTSLPLLAFIQNDSNTGFAAGNNLALGKLTGQDAFIWLLNPDMIVKDDTLAALVDFISGKSRGCIVGAVVRAWTGNQELLFYGGGRVRFLSGTIQPVREQERAAPPDYISGSCLFTHASSFSKYGLLPEDYFLYWEETDWCFRARQKGAELFVCPGAICYDKISTVIGKGYLADYYYSRNGLLFVSRFRKRNLSLALLANMFRMLKRIVTGQWGRARGIFKGTVDFIKRKFHAAQ